MLSTKLKNAKFHTQMSSNHKFEKAKILEDSYWNDSANFLFWKMSWTGYILKLVWVYMINLERSLHLPESTTMVRPRSYIPNGSNPLLAIYGKLSERRYIEPNFISGKN